MPEVMQTGKSCNFVLYNQVIAAGYKECGMY